MKKKRLTIHYKIDTLASRAPVAYCGELSQRTFKYLNTRYGKLSDTSNLSDK